MNDVEGKYFLLNGQQKSVLEFKEENIIEGKTIYEVIRIIQGKPLFFYLHFERLNNSAIMAGIEFHLQALIVKSQILSLIDLNCIVSGNMKIAFNNGNLYVFKIKHSYPQKDEYENGVPTVLLMAERQDPNIKAIDTEFRTIANKKIKEKKVYEAILVDKNGFITEGSRSNIFMVKGRKLFTSPSSHVLPGVTRNIIIELAKKMQLTVQEDNISYTDIWKMDGLFISGTSPKVLPVNKVEDLNFNSSSNSVIKSIMEEYDNFASKDINNFSV